jgi:hypothetical protein
MPLLLLVPRLHLLPPTSCPNPALEHAVKKNTLIRSDQAHAVKVTAGSNVAERKTTKKFNQLPPPDEIPTYLQKVVPVKASKAKRTTPPPAVAKTDKSEPIEAPPKIVKPKIVRPKTKPVPAKAARPAAKLRTAKPSSSKAKAQAEEPAPTPIEPVWEQDNPVKTRIDQLINRNAQLAEQLQRLPQMHTARGKRP